MGDTWCGLPVTRPSAFQKTSSAAPPLLIDTVVLREGCGSLCIVFVCSSVPPPAPRCLSLMAQPTHPSPSSSAGDA